MRVLGDGIDKGQPSVGRKWIEIGSPLLDAPAKIPAGGDDVDFFNGVLPDISRKKPPGTSTPDIKGEPPWIAEADGKDLFADAPALPHEWVIDRDAVLRSRPI